MKTIHLLVQVEVPDKTHPKRVRKLTDQLLDAGLTDATDLVDAADELRNREGDIKNAKAALGWNYHSPRIMPTNDGSGTDLYRVQNEDNDDERVSMVVGANSYRHAALIVAEVIAENDPPGTGFVGCVEKLCSPQGGGTGYYAAMAGDFRRYDIRPNKIKLLPPSRQ
jgi:hypothetical protein